MAKINDRSLPLFFYSSLLGPTSQRPNPFSIMSQSRVGYTGRIVWQYYTEAWYSIGTAKFSKEAIQHQNYPNIYQVTFSAHNACAVFREIKQEIPCILF